MYQPTVIAKSALNGLNTPFAVDRRFPRAKVEVSRPSFPQKMINQANDDGGGDGSEYAAGSIQIFRCGTEDNTPAILVEWDASGRIISAGVNEMRAGCSSTPGGS